MTTSSIATPTEIFQIIDSMDPQRFADRLTPDAKLTFANNPTMVGTDAIVAGCGYFYGTIKALHHTIRSQWQQGNDTIVELSVTYDRLDGQIVTIPVVSVWSTNTDGVIDDYRVYFDLAPVYA
jgi:hypothetical protein